jgi:hypothetical protein
MNEGKTGEFQAIFDVVEHLYLEGDPYVRESTTIGLLEAVQNIGENKDLAPEAFYPYLGPQLKHWWNASTSFGLAANLEFGYLAKIIIVPEVLGCVFFAICLNKSALARYLVYDNS